MDAITELEWRRRMSPTERAMEWMPEVNPYTGVTPFRGVNQALNRSWGGMRLGDALPVVGEVPEGQARWETLTRPRETWEDYAVLPAEVIGLAGMGPKGPKRAPRRNIVWREGATDDLALAYMDAQEKLAAHPEYRDVLANPALKAEERKVLEKAIAEKLGITGIDLGELSAAEKKALTASVRSQYPTAPPYRVADDVPLKVRGEDVVHQADRHLMEGGDGSIFNSAEEAAQAIEQTLASRRGYAPYIESKPGVYMRLQQKPDAPKRGAAIGVLEPGVGEAYLRTAYPRWE